MFKRVLSASLGMLIAASLAGPMVALTATPASAATGSGVIKICKDSVVANNGAPTQANLGVTGPFTYTISGPGVTTVTGISVGTGSCSDPITVPWWGAVAADSHATITETSASWYQIDPNTWAGPAGNNGIFGNPGSSYLSSTSPSTYSATVDLTTPDIAEVTFTNGVVTGWLKVCKSAAAGSGLTGLYSFNVQSPLGAPGSLNDPAGIWSYGLKGAANAAVVAPATTPPAPPGCSPAFLVPAGSNIVSEAGTNLYVTSISASNALVTPPTSNELVGTPNLVTGTATVTVNAGNPSLQTDVYYTNNVVSFEVCKAWTGPGTTAQENAAYTFSFAVSGLAGPNGPTNSVSVVPGSCSQPVSYRAGTQVVVTEAIAPGTKVASITEPTWPTPGSALSEVAGTNQPLNRTVTLLMGTSVSPSLNNGATYPGSSAYVTFTNEAALPGQLELCKYSVAGTFAVTGSYTFGVSINGGTATTVSIPVGSCVVLTGIPFNSTVVISENGLSATNIVQGISVGPMNVTETGGATTELTQVSAVMGTGVTTVLTGEGDVVDVAYTDMDPPVGTVVGNSGTSGTGGVTVNNAGTEPAAGTTTGISLAAATSIASGIATVISTSPATVNTAASAILTAPKALTAAQKKALLKKDEKALTNLKSAIVNEQKIFNTSVGHKAVLASKKLAALKAELRALNTQIKLLK